MIYCKKKNTLKGKKFTAVGKNRVINYLYLCS